MTTRGREREEQARVEVGRTEVGRWTALGLTGLFLLSVAAVTGWDGWAPGAGAPAEPSGAAFGRFAAVVPAVERAFAERGLVAANRELLGGMNALESELETGSAFAAFVGPPLRWLDVVVLGAATEQVMPGRGDWLFLADGVDSLTGPPFLEARRLDRRRRGGSALAAPPHPDPVAALTDFAGQLAARGIRLLVVPAPTKAAIHPDRLSRAVPATAAPLANPSFGEFRARLEAAGIALFDPAPLLAAAARESGEPQFLERDSHWRPEAVDRVARELAREVERLAPRQVGGAMPTYPRRPSEAASDGDLVRPLGLPSWQRRYRPQRVELSQVIRHDGRLWAPERRADVLLLGDSFTNVYSQPGLGWGRGAGLAEQLSYHLGRPVDRIAVNAGGAHASRERLAQAMAAGVDGLAGRRLVVYEFAARELAVGDWRPVRLPAGPEGSAVEAERGDPAGRRAGPLTGADSVQKADFRLLGSRSPITRQAPRLASRESLWTADGCARDRRRSAAATSGQRSVCQRSSRGATPSPE